MFFREKFQITDDAGAVLYECTSQWGWFNRPWILTRDGEQVACFKRKHWTWTPTWQVQTGDGAFTLRGMAWSLRRRIIVQGGAYDGAELNGSLFDRKFALTRHGQLVARANAKFLTISARHEIELLDNSPQAELLTAILMANLLVEKSEESSSNSSSDD